MINLYRLSCLGGLTLKITCIFCGKRKESSLEHVIPEAIGNNSFTTNIVCTDCNSALGATIDDKFVNSFPIEMKREMLGLKGYKGNIPQVLRCGKDSNGNTIILDKDSGPKYIPKVTEKDNSFSVMANSKKEVTQIIKKKLKRKYVPKRKQVPKELIDKELKKIENTEVEESRPKINFRYNYNVSNFKLEFLKIAFEYMNIYYGDTYKQDPIGNRLKNILNQFKSGNIADYSKYVIDVPSKLSTPVMNALKRSKQNIHIILPVIDPNNRLFISILLFNGEFSYSVLVSNHGDAYSSILGKRKSILITET